MEVTAGKISATMVGKKQDLDIGLLALSFTEEKTIDDLKALPANAGRSLWTKSIGEAERHVYPRET
jgi:hypothetical protein